VIVAADRSLDAARAAFLPSIQLGASGGYVDSTLIADPVRIFSIGGSTLAPLFEGGRPTRSRRKSRRLCFKSYPITWRAWRCTK
jgi:outer membrane protein TolC